MQNSFELGDIVLSKAGRDKDKIFVIIQVVNQDFVLISNGGLRSLSKPKLKRNKHLKKMAHSDMFDNTQITNIEDINITRELLSLTQKK